MSYWRIITNQREVIIYRQSRAHALWQVATDKREGESILRIEPVGRCESADGR